MASISLRKARTIIRKTLQKGHEMGLKPLSVVVVDDGGHVIAFEREDGAPPGRFAIANGKAAGVVLTGMPGSAMMARAEAQGYFMTALNGAYGGRLVPVPGGILVRDGRGRVVGGVGVTGDASDNDALAGMAGIEAAGLHGEP
ncbi:GlcG/HbpS family heme-binding protein [Actibacterium sp. XHP0104]|uniref:GlcG/HbpS family heme-binding protein n=1 Tax=Actibacterium sp. XHP0104 TaxID=2984335 RepID=UPI0021E82972|nr:heme-binding protein [Actibacterium sp. XHP0104]MCV2881359.1 heme-binding protein [Actibacterium sp. XHP0104]